MHKRGTPPQPKTDLGLSDPDLLSLRETRLKTLEDETGSLERRLDRIERGLVGLPVARDGGLATNQPASVAIGFTTIGGKKTVAATVNMEEEIEFCVSEYPGGKAVANEPVQFAIAGTSTGSIADAMAGTPGRKAVTAGTFLEIDSDANGKITVYALGTMVESFAVTGVVTGALLSPSHKVTVNVT